MKIKQKYQIREIAGTLFLIPVEQMSLDLDELLTLNEVASEICRILPEAKDEEEIVEHLVKKYEASADEVRPRVQAFLRRLCELGIL